MTRSENWRHYLKAINRITESINSLIDRNDEYPWGKIESELQDLTLKDENSMRSIANLADTLIIGLEQANIRASKIKAANYLERHDNVMQAKVEIAAIIILRAMAIGIRASELEQISKREE